MPRDEPRDIGQLYRGQISLANTWRSRLDRTTNWAVVITAATVTWAFTSAGRSHAVLILAMLLVFFFLVIEGRRYRFFEVWRDRVRLIEETYFVEALDPSSRTRNDWRQLLAQDLLEPTHKISAYEATGRRFKRVYAWIMLTLYGAWLAKLWTQPGPAAGIAELAARATVGPFPGRYAVAGVSVGLVLLSVVSVYATWTREAKGRLRPREQKEEGWEE